LSGQADWITSPDHPSMDELCGRLAELSGELDKSGAWPAEPLDLCGRYGVYRWFLSPEWDGFGFSDADVVRGYLRLSAACLTTTFIITQRTGACRRIAGSENRALAEQLLPDLVAGTKFATVGISHLTTSRQHLGRPVLRAQEHEDGFVLDGYSPWVTGGAHADTVVTGATLADGRQILVALPTESPGVSSPPPPQLVGLTSSHTGRLQLEQVHVPRERLLAGPVEEVMKQGLGAGTGGLQTSTLALGLATAAVDYLAGEVQRRNDLAEPAARLREELAEAEADLLQMAAGIEVCSNENLRQRANSLALRAAQAALAAAKGAGYVLGHPAGRWCREALFFLVWSCPQPVMHAHLCELAGLAAE